MKNIKIKNLIYLLFYIVFTLIIGNFMFYKRPDMKWETIIAAPLFSAFFIVVIYIFNMHFVVIFCKFLFKDAHKLQVGSKFTKECLEPIKYKIAIKVSFFIILFLIIITLLLNSR